MIVSDNEHEWMWSVHVISGWFHYDSGMAERSNDIGQKEWKINRVLAKYYSRFLYVISTQNTITYYYRILLYNRNVQVHCYKAFCLSHPNLQLVTFVFQDDCKRLQLELFSSAMWSWWLASGWLLKRSFKSDSVQPSPLASWSEASKAFCLLKRSPQAPSPLLKLQKWCSVPVIQCASTVIQASRLGWTLYHFWSKAFFASFIHFAAAGCSLAGWAGPRDAANRSGWGQPGVLDVSFNTN